MRVIICNGGFLPATTYGGPVVSIDNICTSLCKTMDFYVLCTDHELNEKKRMGNISDGWNKRENCQVRYFADHEVKIKELNRVIEEINPDVIYLNSLFDARWTVPLLRIAKKKNKRVLLAPRGQLCKNAFIAKYKKVPYIFALKAFGLLKKVYFQSTSEEETEAIKKYLGGTQENIYFLTNFPSVPKKELFFNDKKPGKAQFVFYSRIVPKKNLAMAIKCFMEIEGEAVLDIYGPIEDELYWKECKNIISELPKNIMINYKGVIEHDSVFEVLASYDAFVFPTRSENFGHVISEALFSGCPAIISDQTPWRDLPQNNSGWDIDLNNISEFRKAINYIIACDNSQELLLRRSAIEFAQKQFNIENMCRNYIQALLG